MNRRQARIKHLTKSYSFLVEQRPHEIKFFLEETHQRKRSALRPRHPGEPEILLQYLADSQYLRTHLAEEHVAFGSGTAAGVCKSVKFLPDQVKIERDRAKRIANFMGNLGRHGTNHAEALRLELSLFQPFSFFHLRPQRGRSLLDCLLQVVVRTLECSQ